MTLKKKNQTIHEGKYVGRLHTCDSGMMQHDVWLCRSRSSMAWRPSVPIFVPGNNIILRQPKRMFVWENTMMSIRLHKYISIKNQIKFFPPDSMVRAVICELGSTKRVKFQHSIELTGNCIFEG